MVSQLDVLATGLSALLGRHPDQIELVAGEAGFGAPDPDVVLYDVSALHDGDGSDLERMVKETTSAVIAVSNDLRPDLGSRALALGADGFFAISVERGGAGRRPSWPPPRAPTATTPRSTTACWTSTPGRPRWGTTSV